MRPGKDDVLLVVDVQNDFCPGGALAVPDGDSVVPDINRMASIFSHCIMTQDWHPAGHSSFASSHPGKLPFSTIAMPYGEQVLWPDHCIQGSEGAAFHPGLDLPSAEMIIRKGYDPAIDSYSGFFENDRTTPTGLAGYMRERGLKRIFCVGLATDFCVRYTIEDARRHDIEAVVVLGACRGIDLNGSVGASIEAMKQSGATLVERV